MVEDQLNFSLSLVTIAIKTKMVIHKLQSEYISRLHYYIHFLYDLNTNHIGSEYFLGKGYMRTIKQKNSTEQFEKCDHCNTVFAFDLIDRNVVNNFYTVSCPNCKRIIVLESSNIPNTKVLLTETTT